MKKVLFAALSFCLLGVSAMAQVAYPDSLKAPESKEVDFAMEVMNKMCDPLMQGRGYAKDGDRIASEYIMNEFRAIGVNPIGNQYFQKFNVSVNTFPEKASLEVNKVSYQPGVDFLVDAGCPSITGVFKPVLITRSQIQDRMKLMDKLRDAKETFLLVDNTTRDGETPESAKKIDALVDKMITDTKVQLKGVIIYTQGRTAWKTSAAQGARPVLYITKDTNLEEVKELKIDVAADFKSNHETQNVVGMIEGTIKKDSFILITCHYDNLGLMGKDGVYSGANNSASGVATMLSLAKHFSIIKPAYSIVFIAFAGTELGFSGAQAFVNKPPFKLDQIKLVLNFDLMGNGSDGIKVVNGDSFEDYLKIMKKISTEYKLLPNIDSRRSAPISDHYIFEQKGVPSMFIYSLGGSFAYHNMDDSPSNVPFTKFKEIQNLMIRFIEKIK